MPRARIITTSQEGFQEILNQLRARGFDVDILPPGAETSQPFDLQVKVEEYTAEEALDRAENLPENADLCAYVAPHTLAGERMIEIPLLPESDTRELASDGQEVTTDATTAALLRDIALTAARALAQAGVNSAGPGFEIDRGLHTKETHANSNTESDTVPMALAIQPSRIQDRNQDILPLPIATMRPARVVRRSSTARAALSSFLGEAKSLWALARQRAAFSSLPSQRYRTRTISDSAFWKLASVIAALAVSALLVGASAYRWSPMPSNIVRSPETRQASFEAVLDTPGLASHARLSAKRGRHSRSPYRNQASVVADDVVIYYNRKPVSPPPARLAKPDGIKRYSDLD